MPDLRKRRVHLSDIILKPDLRVLRRALHGHPHIHPPAISWPGFLLATGGRCAIKAKPPGGEGVTEGPTHPEDPPKSVAPPKGGAETYLRSRTRSGGQGGGGGGGRWTPTHSLGLLITNPKAKKSVCSRLQPDPNPARMTHPHGGNGGRGSETPPPPSGRASPQQNPASGLVCP